jgi:hypothetical protein
MNSGKKQASTGQPIRAKAANDTPDKKPPASKIGADKSPMAPESSRKPYSSAAR